jgi:hypothetical protein
MKELKLKRLTSGTSGNGANTSEQPIEVEAVHLAESDDTSS